MREHQSHHTPGPGRPRARRHSARQAPLTLAELGATFDLYLMLTVTEELLAALRRREPAALAALFDAHADRLYGLALRLVGEASAAEDVVQECFLKLLTHGDGFAGRSTLATWLYRVAWNASLDRLRARGRELPLEPADDAVLPLPTTFTSWRVSPEALAHDRELREVLDSAIAALPASLRAVFLLRDVEELTTAETAAVLGLSAANVKVRLHRARLELRERLSQRLGRPQHRRE